MQTHRHTQTQSSGNGLMEQKKRIGIHTFSAVINFETVYGNDNRHGSDVGMNLYEFALVQGHCDEGLTDFKTVVIFG
jgi:hypothetical protein